MPNIGDYDPVYNRRYVDTVYGPRWVTDVNHSAFFEGIPNAAPPPVVAQSAFLQLPPPPAPAPSITPEQRSAKGIIDATLATWGLQALGDRVWNAYISGSIVEDQIPTFIRDTTEYKTRFAGMASLQQKGRAISEAEYIGIERSYAQVARAAGLPAGFYDSPDDFARLIGGEVSPAEFQARVELRASVVDQAPPQVLDELQRLYGIDRGSLTAYVLDENRALPIIQNQFAASQRSAAAARSGFGGLSVKEAEGLVGLGVTDQQATEGFGALVDARELFTSLDAGESTIGRETQIAAAFGGDSLAKRKIEDRRRRRTAQFEGGGSFAASKEGIGGLGSAG